MSTIGLSNLIFSLLFTYHIVYEESWTLKEWLMVHILVVGGQS